MSIHIDRADALKNAIIYSYPHGELDIICAADKPFKVAGCEAAFGSERSRRPLPREKGKKAEGDDLARSMRRARANLRRLALANDFRWFVTLTLDPAKVDRYDPVAIMNTANAWLSNMVQRHGLRYILVPERHQDGAFHFHGFFAGEVAAHDSGTIKRPGIKRPKRPRSEAEREAWLLDGGKVVYNLPQWPLGFTTAMELWGEYGSAVAYICKYVGKQEGQRPMGRWYYSGGALEKPHKVYLDLDYRQLCADFSNELCEFEIPGNRIAVVHTKAQASELLGEFSPEMLEF